jgi:hypothetical protein
MFWFSVKLFTGSAVVSSHDSLFASLSASPSFCQVFADTTAINFGILSFSNVKLTGFLGNCSLTFHVQFAGGQKATIATSNGAITRSVLSPNIARILPASNRTTIDIPFIIPGERSTSVIIAIFLIPFSFPYGLRRLSQHFC